MTKLYGYTYNGSMLAAVAPKTEAQMLQYIETSTADKSKFQVYELVPVKRVPVSQYKFERCE